MNDELSDGDFDEEAEQAFHETPNRLDANRRDDPKEDAQQEDEELALDMRVDDGSDLASSHGGSPGDILQRMVEDAGATQTHVTCVTLVAHASRRTRSRPNYGSLCPFWVGSSRVVSCVRCTHGAAQKDPTQNGARTV